MSNELVKKWVDITTPEVDFVEDNKIAISILHLDQSAPRLQEEVEELKRSLADENNLLSESNLIAILDDVLDCKYVADQQFEILRKAGFNVVAGYEAVCENNDSKFVKTEREAQESVDDYIKRGVDCYYEYNDTYQVYVIRRQSDQKILKPVQYKAVDLSSYIPQ